ncbi:MAG: hypothetical protein NT079_06840, partial [Candidatus Omnitrophica bacterium]|nr:hypothetical protein [Candidatus Omnitrophota bacterium]
MRKGFSAVRIFLNDLVYIDIAILPQGYKVIDCQFKGIHNEIAFDSRVIDHNQIKAKVERAIVVAALAIPMAAKSGMAFIFGTGNNGTAVDENGDIYTADDSLLELGHNILYKESLGEWVFTGKQMRGDKPKKEPGDRSFEDSFSGPNLAKRFALEKNSCDIIRGFIKEYPA